MNCVSYQNENKRLSKKEIERSIIKKFRRQIWSKFVRAINDYKLINNGDKIAVCISGGKDSILMVLCYLELKRHGNFDFDLEFIAMDPGFNKENLDNLKENCKYLGIPVNIFESNIFEVVTEISKEYPCYLCARMRRGYLYSKAQELGCNKIALAHHFNDVIETTLLNVLYAGNFKTMLPKLKATNFKGMELIRPMYLIKEEDIIRFAKNSGLKFMNCGCEVAAGKVSSKRREIKELIKNLKEVYNNVDISIFRSAENVNMDAILGWIKNDEKVSFLDDYDKK
ncbi:MAG TPA: tRNA 2-thiocytidine biosynthesis protein TtcA [Tenericutes bacterium]|nr:tRNA 2-thiocytidine biosynthesis protein TtcA [Mycoplasmatota bacterium]